jgi:hypothetical protein
MLLIILVFTQKVVNFQPEWVAGLLQNGWQLFPEWVAGLLQNLQHFGYLEEMVTEEK